jgi:hypothetical protein
MEQTFDIQTPTGKIYKAIAIGIGTLLGGPLAAGYLIAENYKAFNKSANAKKTWIYAVITTILIFGGFILIPDAKKIPFPLIILIYTAIAYYLGKHYQGNNIAAHINSGGALHNWWRTLLVGLAGLTINVILIFGIALLMDSIAGSPKSTRIYGILNHEITFDEKNISETEIDNIADGLIKATFFDETVTKFVYVKKLNDKYILSVPVNPEIANDDKTIALYIQLRTDLQKQFPDNKIQINLVVDDLDNVVKKLE